MAWRIAPQIVRGEIDNRDKGYINGKLWIWGKPEPLILNLSGHPEPDLAGRWFRFINPKPDETTRLVGLDQVQKGVLGDFTATRMLKIQAAPLDEALNSPGKALYQWRPALYLEWFSESNGRVVIETTDFQLECSAPAWHLTPQDRAAQERLNATAWQAFMQSLATGLNSCSGHTHGAPADLGPELEEEGIEQLLRINELKHEADTLSGGKMLQVSHGPLPLALEEAFWENVLDLEKAPQLLRKEILAGDGLCLPLPETLDDDQLTTALWGLIHSLADHCMYLHSTNHLSDRELYSLLIDQVLEETTVALRSETGWANHICIDEYGTLAEDGPLLYLRYYADSEERERWAAEFPEDKIPPREDPPYDRDQHLPRPER